MRFAHVNGSLIFTRYVSFCKCFILYNILFIYFTSDDKPILSEAFNKFEIILKENATNLYNSFVIPFTDVDGIKRVLCKIYLERDFILLQVRAGLTRNTLKK